MVLRLRIRDVGRDLRGDLYEFTNADGEHPVCLAVQLTHPRPSTTPPFSPLPAP